MSQPWARGAAALAWAWPAALVGGVVGVAAVVLQPRLWSAEVYTFFWASALVFIGLIALVLRRMGPEGASPLATGVLLCAAVTLTAAAWGVGTTGARALLRQALWLPSVWEGQTLQMQGRVAGVPTPTALGWRVTLEVDRSVAPGRDQPPPIPQRVLLHWPALPGWVDPRAGETWRVAVRLRRPQGLANPHGFDTELWMWEQGLAATGSVRQGRADPPPQRLAPAGWGLQPLREAVRERIHHTLGVPVRHPGLTGTEGADPATEQRQRTAAVLAALVMGDQSGIAHADWDVFRATGVGHLVSLSGLHITLWAWLMTWAVAHGWRWLPRLAPVWGARVLLRCPAPTAAAWGGLALAGAYAAFAGWGVPAQRTLVMLAVAALLRQGARRWPGAWVMLTALATVLAWDPWALLQPGFWLSFVAVAVLMSGGTDEVRDAPQAGAVRFGIQNGAWMASQSRHMRQMLHTQTRLSAVLAPLTVLLFGQVSVVGWLANLVAIPVVTLLITPLALAGMAVPGLWHAAAAGLEVGMTGLTVLSSWPMASVTWPVPPLGWGVLAVLGAWLAALRWPPGLRLLGVCAMLPVLWPDAWPALGWQPARPAPGQFELVAVDVGQGSAVLIRTARASVLYDAGPRWGPGSNAGQRVLLPWLAATGERPTRLVLSHRDADHVGGAPALLRTWPQLPVWASFDPDALVGGPVPRGEFWQRCVAGQGWTQDGVRFRWLHPDADLSRSEVDSNNRSCVLHVQGQGAAALLTGDLDARFEAALVARAAADGNDLKADWLMAPHHGSRHSSSAALLQAVQPRWVVVQAGYRNRYGHPAPEVLVRYQAQGARWRTSPDCGAATWRSDQPGRLRCWRDEQPRHWQPMAVLREVGPAREEAEAAEWDGGL